MQLAHELLAQVPAQLARDPAAVDERLTAALADAARKWQGVELAPARFVAWLAARIPEAATSVEHALGALRLADLYLACACAAGDPRALAAFDAAFLAGAGATSDDVKQRLRVKLFVHTADGAPPRIALYAGRGDLAHWVRAALTRMAIDDQRAAREIPTEDALMNAIGIDPDHSPELAQVKKDTRETLQAAFREAVETLSARERTMMLQYYIDGVGLAELGKLFALAPSNVSRTIAKARITLVAQVRRALMRHKKIAGTELDSLIDLVRSQLSLTGGLRGD